MLLKIFHVFCLLSLYRDYGSLPILLKLLELLLNFRLLFDDILDILIVFEVYLTRFFLELAVQILEQFLDNLLLFFSGDDISEILFELFHIQFYIQNINVVHDLLVPDTLNFGSTGLFCLTLFAVLQVALDLLYFIYSAEF